MLTDMEVKKSFKADLRNKRGLLLEIGAVLALGLVISAFAYAPAEYWIERSPMEYGNADVIELTEITRDRPKEVQPRKVVIEKDGRLTNIEVLQSPDRSLADEAIRVLNKSPKWSPGKQRNQTVRVRYTLPVEFRMQN